MCCSLLLIVSLLLYLFELSQAIRALQSSGHSQASQRSHPSPMGHEEGFPQPQFSQPGLVEPQDEGAQATYDPEDAIVFEDAFETGLGEVKGEDEMKSTECVPDPTQLAQPWQVPHAPQLVYLLLAYLWLALSRIGCISTIKHFHHQKQAAGTLHQQQAAGEAHQKHSAENTIKPSPSDHRHTHTHETSPNTCCRCGDSADPNSAWASTCPSTSIMPLRREYPIA